MRRNDYARRAAYLRQLFNGHYIRKTVSARSAVFLGERYAHHSVSAKLFYGFKRELLLLIDFLRKRLDLVLRKFFVHFTQELMLIGKSKIHFKFSSA